MQIQVAALQSPSVLERGWGLRSTQPLVVGGNRNATGCDIAKAAHRKVEIGHSNILKGLMLATSANQRLILLSLPNLGTLSEMLPEKK